MYLSYAGVPLEAFPVASYWLIYLSSLTSDYNFFCIGLYSGIFSILYSRNKGYLFPVINGLSKQKLRTARVCVLVTAAISQVLFERVVSIHNENPSVVRSYIVKVAGLLSGLIVPFILIFWLFGEAWRQSGQFAAILSFAVAIRFVVSPLRLFLR